MTSRGVERTVLAAVSLVLVGTLVIVAGSHITTPWLSILLLNLGSFIVASVAMALIFEYWQLKGLLEDLFSHVRVGDQLQRAQITGFSVSFHESVAWDQFFNESNRLDLMVAYAATWRNAHRAKLVKFLDKPDCELEVVLPDHRDASVLAELAARFEMEPEKLCGLIEEAFADFRALAAAAKGKVTIYFYKKAPHFTFYRFNNRAVFASYRHRPGKGPILTLVGDRGGELYEWIRQEWYGITADALALGVTEVAYKNR